MNDEIQVTAPARLFINGETLTQENIDKAIDLALKELSETNDNEQIDSITRNILSLKKVTDFTLAHLWYGYEKWWNETNQSDMREDTFQDYMESVHEINPTTLRRYITIWKYRSNGVFPKRAEIAPLVFQQDIATKLLDEGYELDEDQWDDLLDSQNSGHLNKKIREIKGKPPTKASYVAYLERTGDIVVWHQEQRFWWAAIKMPEQADNEIERKVLEKMKSRAVNGMGLIER